MQLFTETKSFVGFAVFFSACAAFLFGACSSVPSAQSTSAANAIVQNTNAPTVNPQNASSQSANSQAAASKSGYHLANKYTIGGDAGWDYVSIDPDARRVYVTHFMNIEVLDADTGKVVGQIKNTPGVHGIALVPKIGKGFASDGKTDTVSVIDLKTLAHTAEIKAGKKPDAIVYNPNDDRIYVSNGDSDDLTVIDPNAGKVVGTIPVGGAPEYSAFDDKGTVWTNLEDKNAFVTIDSKTMKVRKTTPIDGCEEPSSIALDAANRRLFIGCKNNALAVIDADSGKAIAKLPIGEHVDATVFDAASHLIYAPTGDGFLTIVHQDSADKYTILDNVPTMRGAKTMALDPKTGKIFSATVENIPPTATAPPAPIGKVAYTPGPFVVITIEK
jgi:YVTN family beta-propeller protein